MKKAPKKVLKTIEVEINENGFTVWVQDIDKNGQLRKLWLIDGSMVREDGKIILGNPDYWPINAEFNEKENSIIITKKPK
jgi:hypothetical protein